jgi:lysophospholipase L1-like esterase
VRREEMGVWRTIRRRAGAVASGLLCSMCLLLLSGGLAAGAGRPLTLVALGDSLPYGSDCGGCTGYVDLYARLAGRALGRKVTVINRAEHNNLDSRRLLAQVRSSFRADLARADIVTLTIGHNDTPWVLSDDPCDGAASDTDDQNAIDWQSYTGACTTTLAGRLGRNVAGVLSEIKRLRAGKPTLIRVTNFYNNNERDPTVPRRADSRTKFVVDAYSKAICGAAARARVPCADVYHAFNGRAGTRYDGRYVAGDHVHPNQRGHALIAKLLARLGYGPLRR